MRRTAIKLVIGIAIGCSSANNAKPDAATGGTGGGGRGGSPPSDAGDGPSTQMDAPGFEVIIDPGTALCPTSGGIQPGTAASPLPDGVEVVSPVATAARAMAINDTAAFWADQRTIHRIDLDDGTDTVILDRSSAGNSMEGLAVDGDTVYFGEAGIMQAFGVAKMPAAGGTPTTIVSGNSKWQVTVADGFVYYYDAGLQEIGRAPVGGGTPTILVRDVDPGPLLIKNGYLYFVHPRVNFLTANVLRVPITAQAPPSTSPDVVLIPAGAEVVAPGDHYAADGVAANDTTLYFDDNNRVMMVPLAGGTATAIYQAPDGTNSIGLPSTTFIGPVLPAKGKVYWDFGAGRCSDLMWSNADGSGVGSRVHGVLAPGALFANTTHLYFIANRQQLLRIPL